jgi:Na+/glutamate symporter
MFSAVVMTVCGLFIKKYKLKWLEDYALPFSIIGGMSFAVFITQVIN